MTTQGFITIRHEHDLFNHFIWLNHDAYPENWIKFFNEEIDWGYVNLKKLTPKQLLNIVIEALKKIKYKEGGDYTIEKGKHIKQPMEYKYNLELFNNDWETPKLYLRTEEEFWIDDEYPIELKDIKTIEGNNYLFSEMRTDKLIQLV